MKTTVLLRRGSALAITMIMAFMLVVVAASFLTLSTTSRRVNDAGYSYHSMLPVAERGVDQAVKTLNKYVEINTPFWLTSGVSSIYSSSWGGDGTSADGWTGNPANGFTKNFGTNMDLGDGRHAGLKVKVLNIPTNITPLHQPYCIAEVTFNSTNVMSSTSYTRQFLVALATDSKRGNGMIAVKSISFNGNNVTIDGYDSRLGAYNAATNRNDQVTVATLSVDPGTGTISMGGANVYGYIATGDNPNGADPTVTYQQNSSHIWGADSSELYRISGQDPNHITHDFTLTKADFPPDTPPAVPVKTVANTVTSATTKLTSGTYIIDAAYSPKGTLAVSGDVIILVVDSSGKVVSNSAPAIKLSGQGQISVAANSSLKIYTSGNVDLSGNGLVSSASNSPAAVYISGVNNSATGGSQSIVGVGNGSFSGVIYAPNASVALKGNGLIFGSIVAYTVNCVGNATFHYDTNLNKSSQPSYFLNAFVELTGSDKVAMGF